jgi:hypothetical protein
MEGGFHCRYGIGLSLGRSQGTYHQIGASARDLLSPDPGQFPASVDDQDGNDEDKKNCEAGAQAEPPKKSADRASPPSNVHRNTPLRRISAIGALKIWHNPTDELYELPRCIALPVAGPGVARENP